MECKLPFIRKYSVNLEFVIPKICSKIRRWEWKLSVRAVRVREKQADILPSLISTEKLTWLADNFLQNESNFFICSQFRSEENFFQCVIFSKCIYRALLNSWRKQYTACYLLVQTWPHAAFLSIEMLGMSLVRAAQSVTTTMRQCFCNLITARETSLKYENKQL